MHVRPSSLTGQSRECFNLGVPPLSCPATDGLVAETGLIIAIYKRMPIIVSGRGVNRTISRCSLSSICDNYDD